MRSNKFITSIDGDDFTDGRTSYLMLVLSDFRINGESGHLFSQSSKELKEKVRRLHDGSYSESLLSIWSDM